MSAAPQEPTDLPARQADPCVMVIFGAGGDLTKRKLIPACEGMTGDATLFQRADMVEAGWSVITPVLDVWKALPPRAFPNYAAGSWGPREADDLMARDGRSWRKIE